MTELGVDSRSFFRPCKEYQINFVRRRSFSAGHRYSNPQISVVANKKMLGDLFREEGFGHNFCVEVFFRGVPESKTGMLLNLNCVDQVLTTVVDQLDHYFINDLKPFRGKVLSLELIGTWITQELVKSMRKESRKVKISQVRLYEGDDVWVDVFV